ncbi:GTP pyrophosphokinase family protein [Succinimonas sp.]|uniref:GTP pyrophosphokinase n=1 Tax=Succinimonas sp. TaxID=1936151 RepID=UPI003864EB96
MKVSNKQINKAGDTIRNGNDAEKEQAIELLNQWRYNHMLPLRNIRSIVDNRLKKLGIECIVGQRLKRMISIIGKITRFPEMSVSKMQDVGGIRIIVPKISDVKKVHEALIKKSKHEIIVPPKDYIETPKPDGYRSIHQVFKYKNEQNEDINNMRIEIQIRTKLQHAWATSVETLGVIDKVSYKSGLGEEENRKFFKLASALFSIKENCHVLDEYKQCTKDELIQMMRDADQTQQILAKLKGLSALKPALNLKNSGDIYFVLYLAADEQKDFSIKVIPFDDEEEAVLHYDALEKKNRNSTGKSVVLVRSKNLKELKKAYPNYFLDTQYFVRTIEDMIK